MRRYALVACGALAACTSGPVTVPADAVFYEVQRPAPPAMAQPTTSRDAFTGRIERVLAEPAPVAPPAADGWAVPPMIGPAATLPGSESPPVAASTPPPAAAIPEPPVVASAPPAEEWASAPAPVPPAAEATPLDDDHLNLNLYTLEQQRIDAALAERELEEARRQLVIVEPGASVPQAVAGVNIALYAKQTTHAVGERRFQRSVLARATAGGNCRRFSSPDQAQRVFLSSGGPERDPYNLDPDGDGFACDWDPEPFRRLRM